MIRIYIVFCLFTLLAKSTLAQADTSLIRTKFTHIDYVKTQYAGEIGFMSLGVGTEFFKKRNGELDLMLGYLPQSIGGDDIITSAIKFSYIPWTKNILNNKLIIQPLTVGVLAYHAFGKDLNKQNNRDLYPRGYYWWTVSTRLGPVFGLRIKKEFEPSSKIKSLSFYVEFGSNDLYIYSWIDNRSLIPIHNIFNSSFGLKANF